MKKLLTLAAAICIVAISFGQKQQTDSKTLEVNFTPLGGSPVSINGIKFRKFTDDYSALRCEVFLGMSNQKDVLMQEGANGLEDNPNPATFTTDRSFNISIRPGIEKHFDGTSRLSPYIGGLLDINYGSSSTTDEYWSGNQLSVLNDFNTDGTPNTANDFSTHSVWEQKTADGSFGFGINGVAGCDFYFADHIYLGVELGFGFGFNSMSNTKYSSSDDVAWAVSDFLGMDTNYGNGTYTGPIPEGGEETPNEELSAIVTRSDEVNGSSFNLGPNVNGALRLGFIIP